MHLSGLFIYPVKGLRGIMLDEAAMEFCGLQDDRRWMLVDEDGRFLSQRRLPAMARLDARIDADGLTLRHGEATLHVARPSAGGPRSDVSIWRSRLSAARAGAAADAWLTAQLGRPCRLVALDDAHARLIEPPYGHSGEHVSFADGFPVLLTSEVSLAALNDALTKAVGMDRFRPNLVVSGAAAWAENDWRALRIGGVAFRGPKPCTRCVVPSIDQLSGEIPVPGEPLETLARLNPRPEGVVFGRNLIPLMSGMLRRGDVVEILG
ncbi:MOSC domain-containing protein [Lichenicoccus sp.]|uniref:MOSC domain-containing protein n=1 Tax=Lichenicoccus sp. TaxID=2781899 RepID=UPI003D11B49C